MDGFKTALDMLPLKFRQPAETLGPEGAEEIRLRVNYRPTILYSGKERELNCQPVSSDDIKRIIEKISGASLQTVSSEILQGYVNCNGLRVGICGRGIFENDSLTGFRDFSSVNIRIPREHKGICSSLFNELYIKGFKNTLIISSPGLGKTSLLRELIRLLSLKSYRIGIADDRNELSASQNAVAQFELGPHTDIIIDTPKAKAAMLLLKSMNEQIIAMDEISSGQDIAAVTEIFGCGVKILATAHASCKDELYMQPLYRKLLDQGIFTFLITISSDENGRQYKAERL